MRLLAWNAPGGHERAFEAMRAKAEQGITAFPSLREVLGHHGIELHRDAAEIAANDLPGGKLTRGAGGRSQGRDASQTGADVRVLLDPSETAGRYEVRDVLLAPRSSPLRLGDERAHACFYVLAGDADVTRDEQRHRVGRGAFGYLPGGHASSIAARGDVPVHVVTWTTVAS